MAGAESLSKQQLDEDSVERFEKETNLLESFFRVTEPISSEKAVLQRTTCKNCNSIRFIDSTNNTFQYFPHIKCCKCKHTS